MIFLFGIIVFFSFIYLMFLFFVYNGLINVKTNSEKLNSEKISLSVIIPFRNESENLPSLLSDLQKQTYNRDYFEVILIDDNSNDNSAEIVRSFTQMENIKLLKNENDLKSAFKKNAIIKGINNSQGEIIVLTDADCRLPENWLATIPKYFDKDTALVSYPVRFEFGKKIFDKIQMLDFAGLILSGAGLIGAGKPIITNAANLAFRKSVFFEVGGYEDNMHLSSGDDELLIQKIARTTNYKIKYAWNKEALVSTKGNATLKDFIQQRRRWASKSLFYHDKSITTLLLSIFLFYLSIFILPLFITLGIPNSLEIFLSIFFTKSLIDYVILKQGEGLLFEKGTLKYVLIAELFQIPYIIIASILGVLGNYEWKSREVKR
jgi:cellulose synthase/poly-beta-1,6-N-acetylglucosamine synthase-like glycosyltransferase